MKAIKLTAVTAAVLLSTSAMANVVTDTAGTVVDGGKTIFSTLVNPAAVSLEVGSLGYGANIAWSVNDATELQAGWAGGDIADLVGVDDIEIGSVDYNIDTDFSNPYLGAQIRPAANWFTVGAGIIVADTKIKARPKAGQDSYKINGTDYTWAQVQNAEATVENGNDLAPYLTVGFRPNLNNKWGVFGEVGAAYMGTPDVTVTGLADADAQNVIADIKDETLLKWFPIAKVGVTYRF